MINFEKFNKSVDIEQIKKDYHDAETGNREYAEVPVGEYEVAIDKLELGVSKKGDPMVIVWFKILEGDFKNSRLFWNQVVTSGFALHKVDEFLRSLETNVDVEFDNYSQYAQMLMDVAEDVSERLEYLVDYSTDKKGFSQYKIEEVYELE